jgi:RHS repeat-associated protein
VWSTGSESAFICLHRRFGFVADDDGNGLGFGHQVLANTVGSRLGHKGRWHEPATGLIENRARFNNPRIGRWMQRDPLAQRRRTYAGKYHGYVDGLNLYQLMKSNPLFRGDPSGLEACPAPNRTVPCCDGNGNRVACIKPDHLNNSYPVVSCIELHEIEHCQQAISAGFTCEGCEANCRPRDPNFEPCCYSWGPPPPPRPGPDDNECEAYSSQLGCVLDWQGELGCDGAGAGSVECDNLANAESNIRQKIAQFCR